MIVKYLFTSHLVTRCSQKQPNDLFVTRTDSPHSVRTLYDCTIYETAQSPGGLSLLPLPVKKHELGRIKLNCGSRREIKITVEYRNGSLVESK